MSRVSGSLLLLPLLNVLMASTAVGQSASARVVAGLELCREVHFPGGWRPSKGLKKAQQNHFLFSFPYEFRKTAAVTQDYLVAAADDEFSYPRDYSGNKFWVNLQSGKVRGATREEWESGVVVPQSGIFSQPQTQKGIPSEEGVLFEGKCFPKSGPQWPIPGQHARISPDGRWIAVQSWEGQDYRNGDIVAPRGRPGKFFIDLYSVSSGQKFAAIQGEHRGSLRADVPLTVTFWLQSRYFIVQLGSHLERMLVCEIPNQ